MKRARHVMIDFRTWNGSRIIHNCHYINWDNVPSDLNPVPLFNKIEELYSKYWKTPFRIIKGYYIGYLLDTTVTFLNPTQHTKEYLECNFKLHRFELVYQLYLEDSPRYLELPWNENEYHITFETRKFFKWGRLYQNLMYQNHMIFIQDTNLPGYVTSEIKDLVLDQLHQNNYKIGSIARIPCGRNLLEIETRTFDFDTIVLAKHTITSIKVLPNYMGITWTLQQYKNLRSFSISFNQKKILH